MVPKYSKNPTFSELVEQFSGYQLSDNGRERESDVVRKQ